MSIGPVMEIVPNVSNARMATLIVRGSVLRFIGPQISNRRSPSIQAKTSHPPIPPLFGQINPLSFGPSRLELGEAHSGIKEFQDCIDNGERSESARLDESMVDPTALRQGGNHVPSR